MYIIFLVSCGYSKNTSNISFRCYVNLSDHVDLMTGFLYRKVLHTDDGGLELLPEFLLSCSLRPRMMSFCILIICFNSAVLFCNSSIIRHMLTSMLVYIHIISRLEEECKETIERVFVDAKVKCAMRFTYLRGLTRNLGWVRIKFAAMNLKRCHPQMAYSRLFHHLPVFLSIIFCLLIFNPTFLEKMRFFYSLSAVPKPEHHFFALDISPQKCYNSIKQAERRPQ